MSAEDVALILLLISAPPATLFPLVYGLTAPWHRSLIGRALMTKATGLALLIDISLTYRLLGADYQGRDAVRLTVFALITVGVWMQFIALLHEKHAGSLRKFRDTPEP